MDNSTSVSTEDKALLTSNAVRNCLLRDMEVLLNKYKSTDWKLVNSQAREVGEILALIALMQRILEENACSWFVYDDLKDILYKTRQGSYLDSDLNNKDGHNVFKPRKGKEWIEGMHTWKGALSKSKDEDKNEYEDEDFF